MSSRAYIAISGTLFSLVALAHLVRVIENWIMQVAQWSVPMEVSWVAFVITFALALWAFNLLFRSKHAS